jgi:dUTP pyrophosphatase
MELKIVYLENYQGPDLFRKDGDGCFDLRAAIPKPVTLLPGEIKKLPLGIKTEFPAGRVARVYPRSGLGSRGITLANNVGIIDSSYRGEWMAPMINLGKEEYTIHPGDRILQAEMGRVLPVDFATVDEADLGLSDRGEGGFGSSGVK